MAYWWLQIGGEQDMDPLDQVQRTFKRVLDVTVAATGLCLMSTTRRSLGKR